jgi:hypothetical protein
MANKRMFTMKIVDSDAFLDMPLSTQCLYFHLNMRADDDGFVSNPKRIKNLIGASDDDLKLLRAKRFILSFEDGVIVIKHWRMHNTIQRDRYTTTAFQEELSMLKVKENKAYSLTEGENIALETKCFQNVSTDIDIDLGLDSDTDLEEDKDLGKKKKGTKVPKEKPSDVDVITKNTVPPPVDVVEQYCRERNNGINAEHFCDYYTARGWKLSNGKKMVDWQAAVRTWEGNDKKRQTEQPKKGAIDWDNV